MFQAVHPRDPHLLSLQMKAGGPSHRALRFLPLLPPVRLHAALRRCCGFWAWAGNADRAPPSNLTAASYAPSMMTSPRFQEACIPQKPLLNPSPPEAPLDWKVRQPLPRFSGSVCPGGAQEGAYLAGLLGAFGLGTYFGNH